MFDDDVQNMFNVITDPRVMGFRYVHVNPSIVNQSNNNPHCNNICYMMN